VAKFKNLTLYHGTMASLVRVIKAEGLQPRGTRPSHDEYMEWASMPSFVYLTASYDLALEHACRISQRTADEAPVAVLEVNIDSLKRGVLYPDEDFLAEEWNSDFTLWEQSEQLAFMEEMKREWQESLKTTATVAYKGVIPATSLTECTVPRWLEQQKRRKFPRRAA
jgi:hypothetical protein